MRSNSRARQQGFTLIELVVVIAILGVLAAVATPLVTNYLGGAKERAYNADKNSIQAAVDAYYTEPRNVKYLGARQYPIKGVDATGALNTWTLTDSSVTLTTPGNPFRGTQGGNPRWRDSGDGVRGATEDNLNAEVESLAPTGTSGWYLVDVTRQGTHYVVDSRNYLIDFAKLITDDPSNGKLKLLDKVPASASTDNGGGASSGSYSWYVDADGKVNSVYYHFPTNGQLPTPIGADNRGYVSGVYP